MLAPIPVPASLPIPGSLVVPSTSSPTRPGGGTTATHASPARHLARVAVFAALIAVLGLVAPIPVPVIPVPITAQTLGVMLAGAVLGPWWGAAAVALFDLLVAVGLPLLAGGRGGLGAYAGPSAGYIIGWIAGALVIGLIVRAGGRRPTWPRVLLGTLLGGIVVVYLFGVPVQAWRTGLSLHDSFLASLLFLPGDAIKAVLATLITMSLWKAYPRAFER